MDKKLQFPLLLLTALLPLQLLCGATSPRLMSEVAVARTLPPGAPKASDVSFTTRWLHPTNAKDPEDSFKAAASFHATRWDWVYLDTPDLAKKIKAAGYTSVTAKIGPNITDKPDSRSDHSEEANAEAYKIGRIVDIDGKRLGAPWFPDRAYGCVNNPEFAEKVWLPWAKRCIDYGADGLQHDGAAMNAKIAGWGGCYCDYCIEKFKATLALVPADKLAEWGITKPATFDYRQYLKEHKDAPKGLKDLYQFFQENSTEEFHTRMRRLVNAYAGRYVPYSCNNTSYQKWDHYYHPFDYAISELSVSTATPQHLWSRCTEARRLGKAQVFSSPKNGKPIADDVLRAVSRKSIGMIYALGEHCIVPWDLYMHSSLPRYYGKPSEYADLYGFVRGAASYLDGYEDAADIGDGLKDRRQDGQPPVEIPGTAKSVYAIVRAKPGQATAPVVVHLVDWSDHPQAVVLRLRKASFFKASGLAVQLLTPAPYDQASHEHAEATKNYSALIDTQTLKTATDGDFVVVTVPAVAPWGMLVVTPEI